MKINDEIKYKGFIIRYTSLETFNIMLYNHYIIGWQDTLAHAKYFVELIYETGGLDVFYTMNWKQKNEIHKKALKGKQ